MNMICKKIKVTGQVQGVFFRAFTQKVAQDLNITGFVKNENDGSVFVFACGTEENLSQLIKQLHQGPQAAHVTNVVAETTDTESYHDFMIKR